MANRRDFIRVSALATSGIVFAGSSQMIAGLDFDTLQKEFAPMLIKKRVRSGMFPQRILGSFDYLSLKPGDLLVLYISEYDMISCTGLNISPASVKISIHSAWVFCRNTLSKIAVSSSLFSLLCSSSTNLGSSTSAF